MHTTTDRSTDVDRFEADVDSALAGCHTYEALAEAFRSGALPGSGRRALVKGRRKFGMHHVASNVDRSNERGVAYGRRVADSIRDAYRYTDADLDARIAAGEDAAPGRYREAVLLRTLQSREARAATVAAARRFSNATADAGRWSDAIASCLSDGQTIDRQIEAA